MMKLSTVILGIIAVTATKKGLGYTWCTVPSHGAQDLETMPAGEVHRKALEESIVLTCSATGVDNTVDPNIKWFDDDGSEITVRTGRVYVENDGLVTLKLYINNIINEDAGFYTCKGTIDGSERTRRVKLDLFKDITFDHAPSPQTPAINTNAQIECRVSGQPQPTVSWRYRGQTITTGGRYTQNQLGMLISNITAEDNGEYLCRAEVAGSGNMKSTKIVVIVYTPPSIIQGPGQKEGVENNEVSISCRASGNPDPKYEFFKDGNINPVSSTDRIQVDEHQGDIHFRPVVYDDRGSYECVAYNDAGDVKVQGSLNVLVAPTVSSLVNVTGVENSSISLRCYSTGVPPPRISFRKVGNNVDYDEGDNEGGRIRVTLDREDMATLQINYLRPDDMANYTCKVVNEAGQNEKNGTITVKYRPRFDNDHPTHIYSWAGKTRNMTCHVRAEPSPAIKWVRFGRELEDNINNGTYRIYNMFKSSNLQIRVQEIDQGWIYGDYKCLAKNDQGEGGIDITMERATVPGEPMSVKAENVSPTRLELVVVPPERDGGVQLLGYRVEFDSQVSDFSMGQPIVLENLRASTIYVFLVRARNEVGVGNPIQYSYKTPATSKPQPIVIISDPKGLYTTWFTINWDVPRTGGRPITEYRILFRRMQRGSDDSLQPATGWTKRDITDNREAPIRYYKLQGLRPGTEYEVQVLAYNNIGWSNASAEFIFSTLPDPSSPAVAEDTSGSEGDDADYVLSAAGLSTGAVIGIVIVVLLIFIIIVDVSCYFMSHCGVTMCICTHFCARNTPASREKVMEAGENERIMPAADVPEADEAKMIEEQQTNVQMAPSAEEQDDDEKKPSPDDDQMQPHEDEESKDALKEELQAEDEADETMPLAAETKEQDPETNEKSGEPPGDQVVQEVE